MTPCPHQHVRDCGGGIECVTCGRLVQLASELTRITPDEAAAAVEHVTAGEPLPPVMLGAPDCEPIAQTVTQYLAPASLQLAASEAKRRGNGHTPPAMVAVQPPGPVAATVDAIRERERVELQVLRARVAELEGRLARIAEMAKGAP